jgi:threonine synthase
MNVGHPSNLARVVALYGGSMDEKGCVHEHPNMEELRGDIASVEVSDEETQQAIKDCYERYNAIIEPHGAVGYRAVQKLGFRDEFTTIMLETAHPAKFPEVGMDVIGVDPEMPESLKQTEAKPEIKLSCDNDYEEFKTMLGELLDGSR